MKKIVTKAIVLKRINYAEADRIITVITPDNGKRVLIAKGVRKPKSKLAGGIELLSECEISYMEGRGDMDTLASTRLISHYKNIMHDLDRSSVIYELLKRIDKVSEQPSGNELYDLALHAMMYLDDLTIHAQVVKTWATMQLLLILGEQPNLQKDIHGDNFDEKAMYSFDIENGGFMISATGQYDPNVIKFLRLAMTHSPKFLMSVTNVDDLSGNTASILESLYRFHRN